VAVGQRTLCPQDAYRWACDPVEVWCSHHDPVEVYLRIRDLADVCRRQEVYLREDDLEDDCHRSVAWSDPGERKLACLQEAA
jgi:hypothetical protein